MSDPMSGVHECCNCGETAEEETMSKDHDGNWFCKECEEPREPRWYPSLGDTVMVRQDKLNTFVNKDLLAQVSGKGVVVRNWDSGWFTVSFEIGNGHKIEHGFYGSDLRVIRKAGGN